MQSPRIGLRAWHVWEGNLAKENGEKNQAVKVI